MAKKLSIAIAFWAAEELLGKSKNSLKTQPSAQFHFQKWNFNTSGQKLRKSRYQSFLILPSFAWLLYYLPNILSGIIVSSPSITLTCVTGPWVFFLQYSSLFQNLFCNAASKGQAPYYTKITKKLFSEFQIYASTN